MLTINERNTVITALKIVSLKRCLTTTVSTIKANNILINKGVNPVNSGLIIFSIVLNKPKLTNPIKAVKKEYLNEIILNKESLVEYQMEKLTAIKTVIAIIIVFIISLIKISIFII